MRSWLASIQRALMQSMAASDDGVRYADGDGVFNEETVRLTRGTSAPETWKRCKPTS